MAHVLVLDSLNEDMFVCGNCKSVFNSMQMFLDHKRTHEYNLKISNGNENGDRYSQDPAEDVFKTLPETQNHRETEVIKHDISNVYSCDVCKKTYKRARSLTVHLKTHNEKPYQCLVCGRCFVQNSHLQRHIGSHKVWPEGITETTPKCINQEPLSYSCLYCDLILLNYLQFRAHLKAHLSIKRFKCIQGQCTSLFETIEDLLYHVTTMHQVPTYACHICNTIFNSLEDIATHHHLSHKDEKVVNVGKLKPHHKCSLCDAVFTRPEKLSLHMLTENHKKTCIYCKKTFTSDKRLRIHLQIHRKQKPFQCGLCGSSFQLKKYLSSHMLKHGESQFTCEMCKRKFKRQDLLQRHMKLHQKKKLQCPFNISTGCKMEFSRTDKLKSHLKHHTKKLTTLQNAPKAQSQETNIVEICILPLS